MTDALVRIHFSHQPVTEIKSTVQPIPDEFGFAKPLGFWYSVGREWDDWCASEDFAGPFAHETILTIDPSRVLMLRTEGDLRAFSAEYAFHASDRWSMGRSIRWDVLARAFGGIEIAPYQVGCRDLSWYYGWDVASGCIWDAAAVVASHPEVTDG